MKKFLILLISIGFMNPVISQESNTSRFIVVKDLPIKFVSSEIAWNVMGGHKRKFGNSKEEALTLYQLIATVDFEGLKEGDIIDFNKFSLLDHENKIRHRPFQVSFTVRGMGYYLGKIDLKEYRNEDLFLKYAQDGYENYDHKRLLSNAISMTTNKWIQTRFGFNAMPRKIEKHKGINIFFYTNIKKTGKFSLYYTDKLIKDLSFKNRKHIK